MIIITIFLLAVADTLLECLQIHGLTSFSTFLMLSNFFDLLNETESRVTVFAPTDAAFDGQNSDVIDALNNSPDPGTTNYLIGFHIVNGTVRFNDILKRTRFDNLAGSLLHGTTVLHFTYNPYRSYGLTTEVSVTSQHTHPPLYCKVMCNVYDLQMPLQNLVNNDSVNVGGL